MKINDYRCIDFPISKFKSVEFQLSRWDCAKCFEMEFYIRRKMVHDHHGFDFAVTLFWHEFRFAFYDSRHVEHFEN